MLSSVAEISVVFIIMMSISNSIAVDTTVDFILTRSLIVIVVVIIIIISNSSHMSMYDCV